MAKLLKMSSHGNSISVLFLSQHGIYRKLARSKEGVKSLKQEYDGAQWYAQQRNLKNNYVEKLSLSLNNYMLDIPELSGKKISYEASMKHTNKFVLRAISHYESVWPKQDKTPVHGDLTLDNILFEGEQINFFDWEHFTYDGEVWGFDAVYLALSAILLNDLKKNVIDSEENFVIKIWQKLQTIGVDDRFLSRPLGTITDIYKSSRNWSNIISKSPRKLFPMLLTNEQKDYFDTYFSEITSKL